MNTATNWTPGVIALSVAITIGVFVLLRSRGGSSLPAAETSRREELDRQKNALYALLRDHGLRADPTDVAWVAERDRLELAAAAVLRDLDQMAGQQATAEPARATDADTGAAPNVAPARPQGWGERNPRLSGAAWGAGAVLFLGALFYGVQESANPRAEGQSITGGSGMGGGGAASESSGGMGGGGMGGGEAAAPQISAAQEARLAELQAAVVASPTDIAKRNELGHALLTVGRLMDSFKEAEAVRKTNPDDPEARTHQAVVLLAIGDNKMATTALDKVLLATPEFGEALAYRGALHLQAGERDQAIALLERAQVADPRLAESIGPLLDEAKTGTGPVTTNPATQAPPQAAAPAGAPSAEDVSGTISITGGSAQPGQTIFILARAAGVERGPPTWVLRQKVTSFPMTFTLGPANAMMPTPTPPQVVITARVDTDGNAMTRGAGDLEGKSAAVAPGTTGVTLSLSPVQ